MLKGEQLPGRVCQSWVRGCQRPVLPPCPAASRPLCLLCPLCPLRLQSGEAKKARKLADLRAELAARGRSEEEVEEILDMPAIDSITW